MGDREIVTLLAAGDPQGLELAYTAYADRIHDYARRMLRSDDAAADVTHDTFLIALGKAEGLRDPDKLRPWLYAIARNECLRVLRASSRTTNLDPEIDLPAEGEPEMSTGLNDTDLRALVHAAAAGLSPKDREVFDLGMRHDLSAPEIAAALGVSDNAAHAMLSRVRTQFERTLGAYVVACSGRDECPELSSMLAPWDGEFDALWRKRIARHVSGCAECSAVEKRELSPSALLGVMPLFLASPSVRERLFSHDELELVSFSRELADRAGPFDRDGFPGAAPSRRRGGLLALALALLLLLGGVGLLRVLVFDGASERAAADPSPTALEPVGETTVSVAETPTLVEPPKIGSTPVLEPAPEPTTAPTSLAPTTAPTTPPSSPPPSSAPPTTAPVEGELVVRPGSITVNRSETATIFLVADGGPVDWTATAPDTVSLSDYGGHLNAGQSTTVVLTLGRTSPAQFTIVFQPGGRTVQVTVVG